MVQQRREVEVAERRREHDAAPPRAARAARRRPAAPRCAGAAAARPGPGTAASSADERAPAAPGRRRCRRGARWPAGSRPGATPKRSSTSVRAARARAEQLRDVDHHVADHLDLAGDPLARAGSPPAPRTSTAAGRSRGRSSTRLSSSGIVRSYERMPGLDVRDRDPRLRAGQRARQRRVRVAVDEHERRAPPRRSSGSSAASIRAVCAVLRAAAELEPVLRPRQPELVEEDLRERLVVVLAGVDEHLVGDGAQRPGHRGGLDELRPIPDHRQHPGVFAPFPGVSRWTCSRSRSATRYKASSAPPGTCSGTSTSRPAGPRRGPAGARGPQRRAPRRLTRRRDPAGWAGRYRGRPDARRGACAQRRVARRPARPRARRLLLPLPRRHRRRRARDPRPPLRLGREGVVGAAGRRHRALRQGRDRALPVAARGRPRHRLAGRGDDRLGRPRRAPRGCAGKGAFVLETIAGELPDELAAGRRGHAAAGCGSPFSQATRRGAARAARRAARQAGAALRDEAPGRPGARAGHARARRQRRRVALHARRQLGSRHDPGLPRPARVRGPRPLAADRPVPRRAAGALPAHARRRGRRRTPATCSRGCGSSTTRRSSTSAARARTTARRWPPRSGSAASCARSSAPASPTCCDARRTFLADEQGLGKTVQALAALEEDDAYPAVDRLPGEPQAQLAARGRSTGCRTAPAPSCRAPAPSRPPPT